MTNNTKNIKEVLSEPVVVPVEAYISEDYAKAEKDKLWRKVWLQAGREEEIPEVGNFITYEILDDSVILVRTPEGIQAYHNVCPHRGRRLIDVPEGARNAHGTRTQFFCGYHGWKFGLNGDNTHIPHQEDWQGSLTSGCRNLAPVKMETSPTASAVQLYQPGLHPRTAGNWRWRGARLCSKLWLQHQYIPT